MDWDKVFITGIGTCNSIGKNCAEFADALEKGKNGIRQATISTEVIGGYIDNFSMEELLNRYSNQELSYIKNIKKVLRRSSFEAKVTTSTVLEAWLQAKLDIDKVDAERISVVVAGSNLNGTYEYDFQKEYGDCLEYVSASYALQFMDTNYVGLISDIFHTCGEGFTVGGASASGNMGIIHGMRLIQMKLADVVIVVAPVTILTPIELQAFINIGAMGGKVYKDNPEQASRPFDESHEGFIYGQGAGCIILESSQSVKKRNVNILAEIAGASIVTDGNHLSNPSKDGEVRAMTMAMNQAGIGVEKIDYINAHGSSSKLGDTVESEAINEVLGEYREKTIINSTKSLTGHCLYSAGVIEAIATIIQMKLGFVHPSLNIEKPIDSNLMFAPSKKIDKDIHYALSNSFGFGGINTSIILRREV